METQQELRALQAMQALLILLGKASEISKSDWREAWSLLSKGH